MKILDSILGLGSIIVSVVVARWWFTTAATAPITSIDPGWGLARFGTGMLLASVAGLAINTPMALFRPGACRNVGGVMSSVFILSFFMAAPWWLKNA